MEIRVIEEEGRREIEVTVASAPGDPRVPRLVDRIRAAAGRLVGYPDGASVERRVVPLADVTHIDTVDGVKIHLEGGAWALLRFSGTEPVLRLFVEAETPEQAAELIAWLEAFASA